MSTDGKQSGSVTRTPSQTPGTTESLNSAPAEATDALRRISSVAAELGAERIALEADELAQRLSEGRFFVAFAGEFKRGKSTLLNALIGEAVLPSGITPVTAVPTVIRFGERHAGRVRSIQGDWKWIALGELEQYVSEEHNPENAKRIEGVEVFIPHPLLATGMCFVDTPGLGSVFTGNTASTHEFVPHIDAALVVIGADPPISGEELALVETVSRQVRDIHIVINKSDRVTDAECVVANNFARRMLERRLEHQIDAIYQVSALERLEGRGPERDWRKLVAALEQLVDRSGRGLIRSAGNRGIRRLGEQVVAIIREEREALQRPIQESEKRIATLHTTISDAERSMHDLSYLFTAEQHRLSDLFLSRRKQFLSAMLPAARAEMAQVLKTAPRRDGPSFRRHIMQKGQEITRRQVTPWLNEEEAYAEQVYRQASHRFVDAANDFLGKLSEAGVPELAQMPHALDPERGFRSRSHYTFHDFISLARPASVFRWVGDLILGVFGAYSSIERDSFAFLERLLEVNSTRVQSDINERVLESRHRLEADIRTLLREVAYVAERALAHAQTVQASGAAGVQSALTRFASLEREVESLAQ